MARAAMSGAPKHTPEQELELLLLCTAGCFVPQLNAQRGPLLLLLPPHLTDWYRSQRLSAAPDGAYELQRLCQP